MKLAADNRTEELKKRMGAKNKGEDSAHAKLNREQVRQIREIYKQGKETQRSLSIKYGVTKGTIQAIIEKRSWKEV